MSTRVVLKSTLPCLLSMSSISRRIIFVFGPNYIVFPLKLPPWVVEMIGQLADIEPNKNLSSSSNRNWWRSAEPKYQSYQSALPIIQWLKIDVYCWRHGLMHFGLVIIRNYQRQKVAPIWIRLINFPKQLWTFEQRGGRRVFETGRK